MDRETGIIRFGLMGVPMARNPLKAGFEASVWHRTSSKVDS